MGHVVMHCESLKEVMPFYQEVLEFKLTDYWLRPFAGYFFHVNPPPSFDRAGRAPARR